jgi:hypothetical protein
MHDGGEPDRTSAGRSGERDMSIGPVEYVFTGEIAPEVLRLVESGTVRILDFVFISKDESGETTWMELDALDAELTAGFLDAEAEIDGLLNEDDIALIAAELEPSSSAALIVWENTWATAFAEAVRAADGEIVAHDRIPREAVLAAVAAAALEA